MKTGALITLLVLCKFSFAQYYTDQSLLYSRSAISGTARSAGSGGAYGSVGADLGSIEINPAGLGLYRSTDFSITPGLKISGDQSNLNQTTTDASHSRLVFAQAGIEWTKVYKDITRNGDMSFTSHPLRSITFALNYQRDNSFDRQQSFATVNNNHSMIDNYVNYMNATNSPGSEDMYLAAEFQLFSLNNNTGRYQSNIPVPVQQNGTIETRGGRDKISLAFGGNFSDKLYFGLGIGVPFVNYSYKADYNENTTGSFSTPYVTGYEVTSSTNITGVGITGNLGLIYRPVSWLRLGASYHLPTWYSMSENDSYYMNATYDSLSGSPVGYYYNDPLPSTQFAYRAPMKGVFSASVFLKKIGFISVDYELQNLGSAHYSFSNDPGNQYSDTLNNLIKSTYGINHTIRIGFEGAYKDLRIRGGYAYSTSPYKGTFNNFSTDGYNEAQQNITAGIGLRFTRFYIDFAYIYSFTKDASYPFSTDAIGNKYNSSTMLLTLGFKLPSKGTSGSKGNGGGGGNYQRNPPADNQQY